MELVTVQRAKENLARSQGYEYVDTTVKANTSLLAPEWEMVMRWKDFEKGIGDYDERQYTRDYKRLLRQRYRDNPDWFHEFCQKDKVAVSCFCARSKFCHRYLIVEILERICDYLGIEFTYVGELH
jgi:hypothetical protein